MITTEAAISRQSDFLKVNGWLVIYESSFGDKALRIWYIFSIPSQILQLFKDGCLFSNLLLLVVSNLFWTKLLLLIELAMNFAIIFFLHLIIYLLFYWLHSLTFWRFQVSILSLRKLTLEVFLVFYIIESPVPIVIFF